MRLRPYQEQAVNDLMQWFADGNDGDPCLVMPTGSGKSHIVAAICKLAVTHWPETRVLMLTHQRELIAQNYEKMLLHWPDAPVGIYSAGMGRRELSESITFAGIQSIRNRAAEVGHIDLVLIDEAHLVSHRNEGGYRRMLNALRETNPAMRVIGLTATPYRLGHGYITDGDALFSSLIEPVSIEALIGYGFLSELRSKSTCHQIDTSGVRKRAGEYVEKDLQAAINTPLANEAVADEIIARAEGRRSWLVFCTGVDHAHAMRDLLRERGVIAETVTGQTPKNERDDLFQRFKEKEVTALTGANVFTTGFDAPNVDLIALVRPTMSTGLYLQMAGRGLRIAPDKKDCLVLDFAGLIKQHGPITSPRPPEKAPEGGGEAPVKVCEQCDELVHTAVKICPACGFVFPPPPEKKYTLHDDDIMGRDGGLVMEVGSWAWRRYVSRQNGREMLLVTYYGKALSDTPVQEYLHVTYDGYAGNKSRRTLAQIAQSSGAMNVREAMVDEGLDMTARLDLVAARMEESRPPVAIAYKKDGRWDSIIARRW